MKSKLLAIIILLLTHTQLMAADLNLKMRSLESSEKVVEGIPFIGVIELWPHPANKFIPYKEKAGSFWGNNLYVSEIFRVEKHKNNADVLEIEGTFILANLPRDSSPIYVEIDDKSPFIQFEQGLSLELAPSDQKSFVYLDQPNKGVSYYIYIVIVILLLALVAWWIVRMLFMRRSKQERIALKKAKTQRFWMQKFQQARTRHDFEEILKEMKKWKKDLQVPLPEDDVNNFAQTLQGCQYRKNWSDDEFMQVHNAFERIRNLFG